MSVKWTEDQQKVINLQKRNILVSAAAGSGKTAVLVERIIRRVMDEHAPVDIDQFLLMTFTEAAASEMKERIAAAIEKQLELDPSNSHLKKQSALVRTAKITTIHSFCLFVIREYFHTIDLDPSFRIGEDGELKLIKQEAVEELLEQAYEEASSGFLKFAEQFAAGKEDKELEGIIMRICEFAESYPNPEAWLDECLSMYQSEFTEGEGVLALMMEFVTSILSDLVSDAHAAIQLCEETDGPYMYLPLIEEEFEFLQTLKQADSFAKRATLFQNKCEWTRMPQNRDKNVDKDLAEQVKNLRSGWKAQVDQLRSEFFFQSLEAMQEDMDTCLPVLDSLVRLVKDFRKIFKEKKAEKNLIDFNDMEHLALQILTREEEGILVPSESAKEISEQFEEILIDEYQDSNYIQEAILNSVSKMSRGEYNVFRVGDVKQSIYRFRLSRPEKKKKKYESYTVTDSVCQRIDLSKNFRSRKEVVSFVNSVFSRLMIKQIGNVEYDEKAALYVGADYPELPGNEVEILLVEGDVDSVNGEHQKISSRELEAKAIAERIHELMKTQKIWDRKSEETRSIQYRDIVILTRSMKGWSDVFVKILKQEGIPAYADSRTGYFSTLEVGWILDYLKVLDNFRQDLPLTAVLKSPFGQCTNEELAIVREAWPDIPFYEAVFRAAGYQEAEDESLEIPNSLHNKLALIFRQLEKFRTKLSYTGIHDLLWEIYQDTGFGRRVAAMPGGEQRYANLLLLVEKAKAFEATSYKGLFHFVRYMEQLREYDVDYGEADIFGESTDAVRIMSIHKSKGLEFPVVILAGMGKSFNLQDTSGNLVIHPKYGIGMYAVNLEKRTKSHTLLKNFMKKDIMIDNLGEEMRVLYVALTRAKEKLILSGVMKNAEEKLEMYGKEAMRFTKILSGRTYFSWVLPAIYKEGMVENARISCVTYSELVQAERERAKEELVDQTVLLQQLMKQKDGEYETHWRTQFSYQYPECTQCKLKYTVSELKQANEPEDGEILVQEETAIEPRFLHEEERLTGASKGSAYHKVMELLNFEHCYDMGSLEQVLEELLNQGYLNQDMKECIWKRDILQFMNSKIGLRMQQAALRKALWREQPFVFGIPAREMYPETEVEDFVLIQGIMDAYFEEEDGFVIVDYKTDRVKGEQELLEKYQKQLDIYGRALEQITGKKVKEKVIYSFTLGKEIVWGKE